MLNCVWSERATSEMSGKVESGKGRNVMLGLKGKDTHWSKSVTIFMCIAIYGVSMARIISRFAPILLDKAVICDASQNRVWRPFFLEAVLPVTAPIIQGP